MLALPKAFIDEMVAHAREEDPNECCGIIAGQDGRAVKLFRAKNSEASPYLYNVDPQDLFRINRECDENGWDFLAIYHSHTAIDAARVVEAYPSARDIEDAKQWPEARYLIVSLADRSNPVLRAFLIVDGQVSEEALVAG